MKRIIFALLLPVIVSTGCVKNDPCQPKTVQSEQATIVAYASANGINATAHSSGLYYEIINPGTGPRPTINSGVSVKYTGKLLNGTIFDQQTTATPPFLLSGVIPGWQIGLPLIQEGGIIKLIIPSSLAYGCEPAGSIPANSILYFEVELVDVQ